ncbi:MAG: ribosome silencing factor [Clostridiales bacterium]|nr:ribosome silencing factor [Clostridiales bacterium]
MTPREIAERIVVTLDNKKGKDIRLLKTEAVTVLADYFVLCTGTGATHLKTLVEEVDKALSEAGEPPLRREGYRGGSWVLLDFGSVIVHLFSEQARSFYDLEHLWADAEDVTASVLDRA